MSRLFPPLMPEDAPSTPLSALGQGKYWRTVHHCVPVEKMSLDYIESAMAFLVRNAELIAASYTLPMYSYAVTASECAADSIEREIGTIESDPVRWIKSTELYRALKKRRKKLRKEAAKK